MQRIEQLQVVGKPRNGVYSMSWAPGATPSRNRRGLGQGQGFFEDPHVALVTDIVATGSTAYLAVLLGGAGNKWATLAWVVTAAVAVKGLHDLARLKK
jgi:hypothetical protein